MMPSLTRRWPLQPEVPHGPGGYRTRKKDWPTPDFIVQLRIQSELEEMALASVRCIAEATHTPAITLFYILTGVLGVRFRHWRWVPHFLSDDQKADKGQQAVMTLAALTAAEK
jgi:hypothetical protein